MPDLHLVGVSGRSNINTTTKKDVLVDKDDNPVYISLGNTDKQRSQTYSKLSSSLLDEDKLKEIRKTLLGDRHYTSEKFQEQITEKLALRRKRLRAGQRK